MVGRETLALVAGPALLIAALWLRAGQSARAPAPPRRAGRSLRATCDLDALQEDLAQPAWSALEDGDLTFSFPRRELMMRDELRAVLEGRSVLFLGNSNLRRTMMTLIRAGTSMTQEQLTSHHFASNDATRGRPTLPEERTHLDWPFDATDHSKIERFIHGSGVIDADLRDEKQKVPVRMCPRRSVQDLTSEGEAFSTLLQPYMLDCVDSPPPGGRLFRAMYQFTDTPQLAFTLAVLRRMATPTAQDFAYLRSGLDAVVVQLENLSSIAKDETQLAKLLQAIRAVRARQKQDGVTPTTFYLFDACHLRRTRKGGVPWAPTTDAAEEGARARHTTIAAALRDEQGVAYVPLYVGELAGARAGLRHQEGSDWHYTKAGMTFHAEALALVMQCMNA